MVVAHSFNSNTCVLQSFESVCTDRINCDHKRALIVAQSDCFLSHFINCTVAIIFTVNKNYDSFLLIKTLTTWFVIKNKSLVLFKNQTIVLTVN